MLCCDCGVCTEKLFFVRRHSVISRVNCGRKKPVFLNSCLGNDRSNPISHVFLPLEVVVNNIPLLPIPIDLHPSTTAMFHFCLPNRPLTFLQAGAVAPTCSGFMCDRREKRIDSVCPCIQKSPVSAWVMCARIVSRDIENEDEESLTGEIIQSLNLTKMFCSEAIIRSSYASIDSQQLRNAVNQVSQFVTENGGWQVCGFYKSGSTDENLAQNVQRVRICKITTAVEVPFNLKYNIVPCNAVSPQLCNMRMLTSVLLTIRTTYDS